MSAAIVAAARVAIGVPFRLHGRDPAFGLDCVGLAALALRAGGFASVVPADYALRRGDVGRVAALIDAAGLTRCDDPRAGDLLLCASGPGQLHLAIDTGTSVIHADAGLGRVIEWPGTPPWPVLARWRVPTKET